MSLILEALRKSEAQRRLGQAPDLHAPVTATTPRGRLPRWLVPALALMLVGAVAWWLGRMAVPDPSNGTATDALVAPTPLPLATGPGPVAAVEAPAPDPSPSHVEARGESPAATAAAPRPAPWAAPTSAPASAPASTPAPAVAAPLPEISAPPIARTRPLPVQAFPTAPSAPPTTTAAAPGTSDRLLSLADLPAATRAGLPELRISMHVFSDEPSRRFAIIDGRRVGEGALLEGQGVVEAIRRDGIVVDFDGRRVLLPRP